MRLSCLRGSLKMWTWLRRLAVRISLAPRFSAVVATLPNSPPTVSTVLMRTSVRSTGDLRRHERGGVLVKINEPILRFMGGIARENL